MAHVPVSAVNGHHHPTATAPDVRWRVLPLDRQPVRAGRAYALELLLPLGLDEHDEHVADVATVVGELVNNAVQVTEKAPKPPPGVLPAIWLGIEATARYTHVRVRDAVPTVPEPREPYADEDGDYHGYGLGIVEALTADWWWVVRGCCKTVHAVVARPGVVLAASELATLR